MTERTYTIGQVARLSGLTTRRLRFYADEGLLPPAGRTESGYRVFSDADLVRIDLIRSLRDAGVGLDAIRQVLAERSAIKDVLKLRLAEIEAQLAAQRRIAAALRLALNSDEPSNDDLRRIWTMTSLSHVERQAVVSQFFDKVAADPSINSTWKEWALHMSMPDLPDEPSADQIDAWSELQVLMNDPSFIKAMQENAKDSRSPVMDHKIFAAMEASMLAKTADAMSKALEPSSSEGQVVADEFLAGWARAHGLADDAAFRERMKRKYFEHGPATRKYWDLVQRVGGLRSKQATPPSGQNDAVKMARWGWANQAVIARLRES